ncbi:Uncharacterised protein [Vibrio cholerae]|uniref:Uncharacterized protein n=1 Tax=Vibrio cholerae TaxID=666 RepID=A0A655YJB4_VIBCL|nr:Uncharacterised protein [Vibrio cholerae]
MIHGHNSSTFQKRLLLNKRQQRVLLFHHKALLLQGLNQGFGAHFQTSIRTRHWKQKQLARLSGAKPVIREHRIRCFTLA